MWPNLLCPSANWNLSKHFIKKLTILNYSLTNLIRPFLGTYSLWAPEVADKACNVGPFGHLRRLRYSYNNVYQSMTIILNSEQLSNRFKEWQWWERYRNQSDIKRGRGRVYGQAVSNIMSKDNAFINSRRCCICSKSKDNGVLIHRLPQKEERYDSVENNNRVYVRHEPRLHLKGATMYILS